MLPRFPFFSPQLGFALGVLTSSCKGIGFLVFKVARMLPAPPGALGALRRPWAPLGALGALGLVFKVARILPAPPGGLGSLGRHWAPLGALGALGRPWAPKNLRI